MTRQQQHTFQPLVNLNVVAFSQPLTDHLGHVAAELLHMQYPRQHDVCGDVALDLLRTLHVVGKGEVVDIVDPEVVSEDFPRVEESLFTLVIDEWKGKREKRGVTRLIPTKQVMKKQSSHCF